MEIEQAETVDEPTSPPRRKKSPGRPKGLPPKPDVVAREQEVVKLRRTGLTWDLIGERLNLSTAGAHRAYQNALRRAVQEDVDAIRQIEGERLDVAQNAIWGEVLQGDNQAVNTLIRIMERRAKLLGLDQPIRIQQEVITYDGDAISAELQRIIDASRTNSSKALPMAEPVSESEPTTAGE